MENWKIIKKIIIILKKKKLYFGYIQIVKMF